MMGIRALGPEGFQPLSSRDLPPRLLRNRTPERDGLITRATRAASLTDRCAGVRAERRHSARTTSAMTPGGFAFEGSWRILLHISPREPF